MAPGENVRASQYALARANLARDAFDEAFAAGDLPAADRALDDLEDALEDVRAADQEADRATAALAEAVRAARARGVSWARIGDALGVTKQTAWERFGRG